RQPEPAHDHDAARAGAAAAERAHDRDGGLGGGEPARPVRHRAGAGRLRHDAGAGRLRGGADGDDGRRRGVVGARAGPDVRRPGSRVAESPNHAGTLGRMTEFKTSDAYRPTGDQPSAIAELSAGIEAGERYQTLLGATGTGKTATMAWIVEQVQKP